jgi:hypothetical protein
MDFRFYISIVKSSVSMLDIFLQNGLLAHRIESSSTKLVIHTLKQVSLGIIDHRYALIIIPLLIIIQAPTCFDTYVPSSESVFYPCELLIQLVNYTQRGLF